MDKIIKLNGQTSGRDKIARLVQYLSRAIYDSLQQANISSDLVEKLKNFEYILSSFRKLLRLGKCVDVFYSSLSSIHNPDLSLRVTLTLSKISQAIFLFADHIIWFSRTGLFKNINTKKWNTTSNKYWLLSIVMNLVRDVYEITRIVNLGMKSSKRLSKKCEVNSVADLATLGLRAYGCAYEHKDVVVDTIKNVCDFFIPLTNLGYTKLTPRTIGILGTVSSIAGLVAIIQPAAKLVPM